MIGHLTQGLKIGMKTIKAILEYANQRNMNDKQMLEVLRKFELEYSKWFADHNPQCDIASANVISCDEVLITCGELVSVVETEFGLEPEYEEISQCRRSLVHCIEDILY